MIGLKEAVPATLLIGVLCLSVTATAGNAPGDLELAQVAGLSGTGNGNGNGNVGSGHGNGNLGNGNGNGQAGSLSVGKATATPNTLSRSSTPGTVATPGSVITGNLGRGDVDDRHRRHHRNHPESDTPHFEPTP